MKRSSSERLRWGLDVVEMLLDDELQQYAAEILQGLLPDLEGIDIPSEAIVRFRQFQIRCMNDLCAYGETLAEINRALPLVMDEERSRLQAQRAEIQLLKGEFDAAIEGLNEKEPR